MKRRMISLLGVVLLLFVTLPINAVAGRPSGVPATTSDFSSQRILVKFKPGTSLPEAAEIHRQLGGQAKGTVPGIGVQVVTVPKGQEMVKAKAYSSNPRVAYAEPDYVAQALAEPDDTYFPSQWGMRKVEAPAAWDVTTGNASVVIAIVDTGVAPDHPDLRDKIIDNVNFSDSPTTADVQGHGTHVAGIAAASTDNAIGVAGLSYDSSIMNVKVLDDSGSGYYSWVASGITWAADNGAHVINLSLGGKSGSQVLEDAVNYAWGKGAVVVAAAGNSGTSAPCYPAYYANCIAVAATDGMDDLASWSTFGDWVDVAAPGVSIYSTLNDGDYDNKSGTSMASPHVAGLAALVFTTVTDDNDNGLLNDEVRSRIESTCDDIGIEGIGSGRINAARAVQGDEMAPQPDVQIVKTADATTVSEAGTVITYTYTVTNTGDITLTGIAVTDDKLGNIAVAATTLDPGAATSGTAAYTVSQADIDSGADIVNTATVTTDQGVTSSDTATVSILQEPAISIEKTADATTVSEAGTVITYTYTVTNTGDITLTGIAVTDDKLGNIAVAATTLDPGAATSGTAAYSVTQADIDSGVNMVNTATVTTEQGVIDNDTATVSILQQPDVQIVEIADPTSVSVAGTVVSYTYILTNTGDVTLTGITVNDDKLGSIPMAATTLDPGAATSGTATYTVSQDDIDSGADIVNTATVTTEQGVTDSDSATVSIVQQSDVQIVLAADPTTVSEAGTIITYTYTVSNRGDVTLTGITVSDDKLGSIALAATTLDPGAATTGTATYTITQADIDSGVNMVNTATVTTDQGVTDSDSATVSIEIPEVTEVTISPAASSDHGWPGEDVLYIFTVQNAGNVPDAYSVYVSSSWASSVAPQSLALEPGATATITVTHSVPDGVSPDDFDSGTVEVLSSETGAFASASFTTTTRVSAVEITPGQQAGSAAPGETVRYTYTISNTGTEDDVYDIVISATWEASLTTTSVSLQAGTSAQVLVSHIIPADTAGDTSDAGILTASSERASASATFTTTAQVDEEPAAPVISLFNVSNTSNPVWARAAVVWAVSDEDGNLATVEILMVLDGEIVDSAVFSVSGYDASGRRQLRNRDSHGRTYEITLIATDVAGNTSHRTESIVL